VLGATICRLAHTTASQVGRRRLAYTPPLALLLLGLGGQIATQAGDAGDWGSAHWSGVLTFATTPALLTRTLTTIAARGLGAISYGIPLELSGHALPREPSAPHARPSWSASQRHPQLRHHAACGRCDLPRRGAADPRLQGHTISATSAGNRSTTRHPPRTDGSGARGRVASQMGATVDSCRSSTSPGARPSNVTPATISSSPRRLPPLRPIHSWGPLLDRAGSGTIEVIANSGG
jgi:hypothetical protein